MIPITPKLFTIHHSRFTIHYPMHDLKNILLAWTSTVPTSPVHTALRGSRSA